jgi:hypothetical protein
MLSVIASATTQSVGLMQKSLKASRFEFKISIINQEDWFSETPIPHTRNDRA